MSLAEICIALEDQEGHVTPIRSIIIKNVSGFVANFHKYQEITTNKGATIVKSVCETSGSRPVLMVHRSFSQKKLLEAKEPALGEHDQFAVVDRVLSH